MNHTSYTFYTFVDKKEGFGEPNNIGLDHIDVCVGNMMVALNADCIRAIPRDSIDYNTIQYNTIALYCPVNGKFFNRVRPIQSSEVLS